jgi:flagellar motor switch protein FliM
MSDALSQEEIDALRAAVATGTDLGGGEDAVAESPDEKVRVTQYDFRKPRLISHEDLHVVEMLHEEAGKSMEALLTAELKMTAEIKLATMDQITYAEFVMASASPTYILKVSAQGFGNVAIEIGMPVLFAVLDVVLGGEGAVAEEAPGRELTVLEKAMLEGVVTGMVECLSAGWSVLANVDMKIQDIASNSEYLQAASQEAPCLNMSYEIGVASASGLLSVCYPLSTVQAILKAGAAKKGIGAAQSSGGGMLKAMGNVPLRVTAELGRLVVLAEDLGKLNVGDVVCMDKAIDEPIDVMLGQAAIFSGYLGKRKDRLAVELLGYKG